MFDTIRTAIRTNKMQSISKIAGYADIMMYCSRILRHFAIFETDVFSPTVFTNIFESTLKVASAFSKDLINETNADIFMMARLKIETTTYERNFREEYQFDIDTLKEAIPDNVILQPQEVLFLRILCVMCAVSPNNIVDEFYLLKVYNCIQKQDADNVVSAVDLLNSTTLKEGYTNGSRNNSFLAFISALTSELLIPELRKLYDYYISESKQDVLFSEESRDFFFGSQSNNSISSMTYFMKMFSHKSV